MIDETKNGAAFVAQLYDVRTKRDGGGRVSLDFGKDALEAVQFIQKVAALRDCNFEVAMVLLPKANAWIADVDEDSFNVDGVSFGETTDAPEPSEP